jgi:hypothetical protein
VGAAVSIRRGLRPEEMTHGTPGPHETAARAGEQKIAKETKAGGWKPPLRPSEKPEPRRRKRPAISSVVLRFSLGSSSVPLEATEERPTRYRAATDPF